MCEVKKEHTRVKNIVRKTTIGVSFLIGATFCAVGAQTEVAYTYTGNNFTTIIGSTYSTSDRVSGELTFSTPLGDSLTFQVVTPVSFSFTDGDQTFTQNSSLSTDLISVSTGSNGDITNWFIDVGTGTEAVLTEDHGSVFDEGQQSTTDRGVLNNDAGTWIMSAGAPSSAPEPSAVVLLGLGLAGLAALKRRA